MRLFREVASRGSITEAARHNFMSQQALSRKMAALEAELGQRLLARTAPLGLTPAGKIVLQESNAMLAVHDRMVRTLDELKARTGASVRVRNYGTGSFVGLYAALLERVAESNPEIDVQFVRDNEDDVEMLAQGKIDLGFVRTIAIDGRETLARDPRCAYLELRSDIAPLIFGVTDGHPLAESGRATLAQIADYPLAMPTDTDRGALPAAVKRLFSDVGLAPSIESVYCNSAGERYFEFFSGMSRQSVTFFTDWSFDDFIPGGRLGTRHLAKVVPGPENYEVRGYAVTLAEPFSSAVGVVLDIVREVDAALAPTPAARQD